MFFKQKINKVVNYNIDISSYLFTASTWYANVFHCVLDVERSRIDIEILQTATQGNIHIR